MSGNRTTLESIWKKVSNYGDLSKCWEWQGAVLRNRGGYGLVSYLNELNGSSKLNIYQVRQVISLRQRGLTQQTIASKFNVSRRLIGMILSGKRWASAVKGVVNVKQPV